jgi:hypothetical protein
LGGGGSWGRCVGGRWADSSSGDGIWVGAVEVLDDLRWVFCLLSSLLLFLLLDSGGGHDGGSLLLSGRLFCGCLGLFGLGEATLSPGDFSLLICHCHKSLSCATFSHRSHFPSLFSTFSFQIPLSICFLTIVRSIILFGIRVWSDRTMALLLVASTPPWGLEVLVHAVRS